MNGRLSLTAVVLSAVACSGAPESPVRSSDGVEVHFESHGTGDTALILVHGWSGDLTYWSEQLSPLSAEGRVVAIDLAGHGQSSAERTNWSIHSFADDVRAVVEHLGLESVVLVGHSMGSPVVLEAAHLLGPRAKGVVHVDAFGSLSQDPSDDDVDAYLAPFIEDYVSATEDLVRNTMFIAQSDPILVDRIASDMASSPRTVGLAAFSGVFEWLRTRTPTAFQLGVPQLFLNSQAQLDRGAAAELGLDFEEASVPGVGHFVMLEAPGAVNELLAAFYREVAEAPGA